NWRPTGWPSCRPGRKQGLVIGMDLLRTLDDRFVDLPGYPFRPNYLDVPSGDDGSLRLHYLDEGPAGEPPVLLLHGTPSWSYLYRKMIPPLAAAGFRVVAPDLPGFGRSDKPVRREDYSYQRLVDWLTAVVEELDLQDVTLFGQDWGGLIGLRLVAAQPDRFARLVLANTGLPTGDQEMPEAFYQWKRFSQKVSRLPIGRIINGGTVSSLPREVLAAYEAPFPDESYKAGPRVLPTLVPVTLDDPGAAANRRAWRVLLRWRKPVLTTFSDGDPITRGGDELLQKYIPGARGRSHATIQEAGHFLQEDKGEEVAGLVIDFIRQNP
ncbi:MAG TPA: haloalkane dehalogenase, partial [Desulfurivibrionaceae bacterium]|nr:haloalkane dehalogenase [Desulfurivibrionaceae bacterium]